ncbi:MAG: nucleotidyltransferase [Bacillota bacterium]
MITTGIVAEYNPFHKGHAYHLQSARKITDARAVVVVMSGNFTQRGEPAAFNKWQRARWALNAGADLVLELPTVYAVSSAEGFASGAISILHRLGVVDGFCFGSETEDTALLERIANLLLTEPPEFQEHLHNLLDQGHTLARARALAAVHILNDPDAEKALISPNAILALEYLKAKQRLNSPMRPHIVRRRSAGYHQSGLNYEMPSATAIRERLFTHGIKDAQLQSALPPHVYASMQQAVREGFRPVRFEDFSQMIFYSLRKLGKDGIAALGEVGEGLESRIYRAAGYTRTINELLDEVKTRRYTRTRLQRILLYALLGVGQDTLSALRPPHAPVYARVLGFTRAGSALLGAVSQSGNIGIISKAADYTPGDEILKKMFSIDVLGSDLYATVQKEPRFSAWGQDFTQPIIKL